MKEGIPFPSLSFHFDKVTEYIDVSDKILATYVKYIFSKVASETIGKG